MSVGDKDAAAGSPGVVEACVDPAVQSRPWAAVRHQPPRAPIPSRVVPPLPPVRGRVVVISMHPPDVDAVAV